jgi:hypothetical protein
LVSAEAVVRLLVICQQEFRWSNLSFQRKAETPTLRQPVSPLAARPTVSKDRQTWENIRLHSAKNTSPAPVSVTDLDDRRSS